MYSFFSRHEGNQKVDNKEHKNNPWKDAGWTAWEIWGGDEAYRWVSKLMRMFDKEEVSESILSDKKRVMLKRENKYLERKIEELYNL